MKVRSTWISSPSSGIGRQIGLQAAASGAASMTWARESRLVRRVLRYFRDPGQQCGADPFLAAIGRLGEFCPRHRAAR
ncbi:hypothetical protein BA059_09775 [Mycolicibacterium sp. (ex Dasyatis americana)]|nr:hypothetical protein BA059_09775 [Mycolicibacterium sp. (ex Dasyatis americana)]